MRQLLIMFVLSLLQVGCKEKAKTGPSDPAVPRDSWNNATPSSFFATTSLKDLPPADFALVTANEKEAIEKLASSSWVKVTPDEAKAYTGRVFNKNDGQLLMLRALELGKVGCIFSVTCAGSNVRVHNGCLGNDVKAQTRRAIIAYIPEIPTDVFVDTNVVQD